MAMGILIPRYADRLGRVKDGSAAVTFETASDLDEASLSELIATAYSTVSDVSPD